MTKLVFGQTVRACEATNRGVAFASLAMCSGKWREMVWARQCVQHCLNGRLLLLGGGPPCWGPLLAGSVQDHGRCHDLVSNQVQWILRGLPYLATENLERESS